MYTTIARVQDEMKAGSSLSTADQRKVMSYIASITQRIRSLGWDFEPQYGTEYFTAWTTTTNVSTGRLSLINRKGQRLLLASSTDTPTIVSDSVNKVWGTDVLADPQGYTPIRTIRLSDANGAIASTWYPCGRQFMDTILVTGWWGYCRNYPTDGWLLSSATVNENPLTADDTTITITPNGSVNATDAWFRTPQFSSGNLIRIENECCLVLGTDNSTNTLSVRRGTNGTTRVQHALGTAISIWEPDERIWRMVSRQVAFLYARIGAYEQVVANDVATVQYPRDMLVEIMNTLQEFSSEF